MSSRPIAYHCAPCPVKIKPILGFLPDLIAFEFLVLTLDPKGFPSSVTRYDFNGSCYLDSVMVDFNLKIGELT